MNGMLAYNTLLVLCSTALLGMAAGMAGLFVQLRRRALVSDAVSHATLPGVALGFLAAHALGLQDGRHLPTLLIFAALTGLLAVCSVQWIRDHTRLPEDSAIACVLGVFYGAGIVLLGYIQSLPDGNRAGLDHFLLGQSAALNLQEGGVIITLSALICIAVIAALKPFTLLCFDEDYAGASALPRRAVDLGIMALMLASVCVGLKTVGLVLIVALLIIPPMAARFWTKHIYSTLALSAVVGGASCIAGALISAHYPHMPTGAVIVLCASAFFTLGLLHHTIWPYARGR